MGNESSTSYSYGTNISDYKKEKEEEEKKNKNKSNENPKEKSNEEFNTKNMQPKMLLNPQQLNQINSKIKNIKIKGGSLNEDIRKVYKFKKVLGGGHFGSVRIAYKKTDPNKFYAVKSIKKQNLTAKDLEALINEVDILASLKHPNIIKFYETYYDEYFFHIVMELCNGKDLFEKVISLGSISEKMVNGIILKVLNAIAYSHSKGITHRDLKPENILIFESEDDENDFNIKLIDFGLSKKYNKNEKMHSVLGTPYYVAPEVLKGDYNEKCDIWSIGILTYVLLTGQAPYNGSNNNEIFNKIINEEVKFKGNCWKNVSNEAIDFIKKCLIKDYNLRPSAKELVNHNWFVNIKNIEKKPLNNEILQNLKKFVKNKNSNFKKIVMDYFVNNMSSNELKNLTKAFNDLDTNQSGHINLNELKNAFTNANISLNQNEIKTFLENNYDEKIDYNEFLSMAMNTKKNLDKDKLINAFKYFDIDNSGEIDKKDIKNVLLRSGKDMDDKDILEIIKDVTKSGEEKISLNKFLELFDLNE